jgi:hypothetical protein
MNLSSLYFVEVVAQWSTNGHVGGGTDGTRIVSVNTASYTWTLSKKNTGIGVQKYDL